MKSFKIQFLLTAGVILTSIQLCFSQAEIGPAIINSTGGSASKSISLEWSLGEMTTVSTVSSAQLQVSAGILQGQPWQAGKDKSTERPVIFPNPVTRTAFLRYNQPTRGIITCELTDGSGRIVRSWNISHSGGTGNYSFGVQDIPAGSFFCILRFSTRADAPVTSTDVVKFVRQ